MKLHATIQESETPVNAARLAYLAARLASLDDLERQRARDELAESGEPALAVLVPALRDRREVVRWEAAKTLGAIGSPNGAIALINALEDQSADVRRLAAEGLIRLGDDALRPLLRVLVRYGHSPWLLEGAHHVLKALGQEAHHQNALAPVLRSIDLPDAPDRTPIMAYRALRRLKRRPTSASETY